jgi:transcription elongation factor Elf1
MKTQDLLDQGFLPVVPSHESDRIDRIIALSNGCPFCGSKNVEFQPRTKFDENGNGYISYRAFVICNNCGKEFEF